MNGEQLLNALAVLGVQPGMSLEVHTSFRRFGFVEGGPDTLIGALEKAVGTEGSIAMPSFRLSHPVPFTQTDRSLGVTCKLRILPPDAPVSGMGIVADRFRKMPDVVTGEGIFRVSVWGKYAAKAPEGFGWFVQNGGWGLLLGVDIYRLSAMHSVEYLLPEAVQAVFRPSPEVQKLYPPSEWLIETGLPPVQAWYTIQRMAMERGFIRTGTIGSCPYMFFRLSDVVGLYEQKLRENACALYGIG